MLRFFSSLALALFELAYLAPTLAQEQAGSARGLIYSATADFRHDSIPTARDALIAQGTNLGMVFDATEDKGWFTDTRLADYDVLLFLMNTGEGLSPWPVLPQRN